MYLGVWGWGLEGVLRIVVGVSGRGRGKGGQRGGL